MEKIKIGILREGKVPADKRVPLLPHQCMELLKSYGDISIYIQPSDIRCIRNKEYTDLGLTLSEDLSHCDILLGIKEVPAHLLFPDKTYLFFSHTIKKQPQNQKLLQSIIKKKIRLIDYECLTDAKGNRIIAFGRYAGLVGTYNAMLIYGIKYNLYNLKPAHECFDLNELKQELKKVKLPGIKIIVTGGGRVAGGALEILDYLKIKKIHPEEFINIKPKEPVYAQLNSKHYHIKKDGSEWNSEDFYSSPENYISSFSQYLDANMLIAAAYWDPKAPALFTKEEMSSDKFKIKIIADITCDIAGSIPSTIKPCTIYEPAYDYNISSHEIESPFSSLRNITVMAIDHLPGELPRDASNDFGRQLIDNVFPHLLSRHYSSIIERAVICNEGSLSEPYLYLQEYVNE